MDMQNPSMNSLFEQLGLPSDDAAIDNFIDNHKGLNKATLLEDAPFWNQSQRLFISDALRQDAEWAEVIDQLNTRLR